MAWAPIDQQTRDGIEMIKLRHKSKLPTTQLLGHVTLLWLWALDNAIDGRLPSDAYIIADAMRYEGDPEEWLGWLIASGFVLAINPEGDELEIAYFAERMAQYTERMIDHLQKGRERVQRYRDRIREQGESVTGYTKHRKEVYERDNYRCVYCMSAENLCLDHLVPIIRGGDHESSNLVAACKKHNSGKAGRLPTEAGYTFAQPHVAALYAESLSRAGIAPVTVTGDVTVTPVTASTAVTFRHAPHNNTQHDTTVHQTIEQEDELRARANTPAWISDEAKWEAFAQYEPTPEDRAWAALETPSIDVDWELANHHDWCAMNKRAIIEKYDSPVAFWRRWMRRAVEKQAEQQKGTHNGRGLQERAVGQVGRRDGSDSHDRIRARRVAE